MIYLVEDFKVLYCKFCNKKPKKRKPKICRKCAMREVTESMIDNINGKIHLRQ